MLTQLSLSGFLQVPDHFNAALACGQPRISRSPAVRQVGALLKPACAAPWRLNGKPFAGTSASSA
jgi:hypothetical protein